MRVGGEGGGELQHRPERLHVLAAVAPQVLCGEQMFVEVFILFVMFLYLTLIILL